jgi:hypothetical protein
MLKLLLGLLLAAGAAPPVAPGPARYQEGQVWEYRTRPGDEGSLLKIQRIEAWPAGGSGQVYHISVIGVRLGPQRTLTAMHHLPVSELTLNASVTRLSPSTTPFPRVEEGLAMWRDDRGGVFDIPLAEIIATADRGLSAARPAPAPVPVS